MTNLLFLDLQFHLEIILMQPTLGLLRTFPTTRAFTGVTLAALLGAVPITDALVSLAKECVAGHVVLVDVRLDGGELPCEEGVEFYHTGGVDFERL